MRMCWFSQLTRFYVLQSDKDGGDLPVEQFGLPRGPAGTWASCLRILDPALPEEGSTIAKLELDANEAAFSMALVPFAARDHNMHLVVGTAKDTSVAPRACSSGYLRTYAVTDNGRTLELLHIVSCALY